ncbi:peptide ABC transporter permease [Thermosipho melanesiensis]|uniref:Binding-protein-dependent transport systems inner membrane component n=2 Tax=Thermosipho melanesiensis TaxID=46541 RepID=A6LM93_THEM4|nr:ABC transporter permease [Thermosipho melanesiensis]ABR31044.1 binding-protein-dependent transport systems inner membrane component [Thermosipho melanesiensis BI429]APT74138.1 peptide ABC transporter permease [Thermosipho melanesiensis]OOC36784.1 peptide ABC transporter permease [Thermosipho melanesiensis]OOC37321.1 peptide ABC transporter permease [Thermosipho melanesiensis]OOC38074.1 peptide ABC transporter permease [Thermosipho melanesiensis]
MRKKFLSERLGEIISDLFKTGTGLLTFIGAIILIFYVILAVFAPQIASHNPIERVGRTLTPPNEQFIFGTDNLGRDIFSRVIYGARIALTIAFIAVLIAAGVGIPLGLISGYVGGAFDRVVTLIMDAIYSFPGLILAIAIAAVLGPGVINISVSIAVVYTPTYFRVIRNQVSSIKSELYVEAARALGAKNYEILLKYIFPNVLPSIVVVLSMNLADAIMTEAGLSFLGLGIAPPTPDWGFDLSNGQRFVLSRAWWGLLYPGLAIVTVVLGFSMFSEGLNELLNPTIRERR